MEPQAKAGTYTPPTLTVIGSLSTETLVQEFADSYSCPKGSR